MLRPLYNWVLALASGPYALPVMAGVAVVEATFPFVPPDVMLSPMVLARRERAWFYAAVCTIGSVTGGLIGYGLGYFLTDVATRVLTLSGHAGALASFQALFAKYGLAVILIKGFTPVPYMLVTLASGVAHFNLAVFVAASLATRGGRFFLEAALLSHPKAKAVIDRHLTSLFIGGVILVIGVFLLVHHLGLG
ncbi:MAG: VTT domain-containing protein [Caulobacteraceae bacterium]|nr:VTT domain-containing protein [Caulobacteraceae bacterium]